MPEALKKCEFCGNRKDPDKCAHCGRNPQYGDLFKQDEVIGSLLKTGVLTQEILSKYGL